MPRPRFAPYVARARVAMAGFMFTAAWHRIRLGFGHAQGSGTSGWGSKTARNWTAGLLMVVVGRQFSFFFFCFLWFSG